MAKLSDEEKAKEFEKTAGVDGAQPANQDEPADPKETEDETEEDDEQRLEGAGDESEEEEKPSANEEEPEKPEGTDSPFTKQFPNLKGDTKDEYIASLEEAYDKSFKEGLRLDKERKDDAGLVERAKAIIAAAEQPVKPGEQAPANQPQLSAPANDDPAIAYARSIETRDMMSAFDEFKKKYPEVTEPDKFEAFKKASDGVAAGMQAVSGRRPTYDELFPAIAGSLGWKPADETARKNAAIKENASSSGRRPGGQSAVPSRKPKVSEKQIETYMKLMSNTSMTREQAIKDLSEVVA